MTTTRRRPRLLAALLLLPLLGACGSPPWDQEAASAASPSASASPSPSPSAPKVKNDLAKGSVKRQLAAGGVTLSVNYFSTLSMQRWTPEATKPLSLGVSGSFGDGSKQDIFLSTVTANIDVQGAEGPLAAPEPLADQADVAPGYLIKSPSSYSQVFTLPALPPAARSVTLNLTYELLAQSAPKSKTYLKQSASDTLVIALTEA
jgi:hypothetical protein